jgi:hypothetical protein
MTQTVQTRCPGCQQVLLIPADWKRDALRCKHCHTIFQARANRGVPESAVAAPVPARVAVDQPLVAAPAALAVPAEEFAAAPPLRQSSPELLVALLVVGVITLGYVLLAQDGVPKPSSLLGHGLGIVGFVLMLATETLYSLRKRSQRFPFGRTNTWLKIHIVTGIVGPYLVLLHTGWHFHGLAGILTLLTVLVVVSGFVGRYIYTAVPRTLDGVEVEAYNLEEQIARADRRLQALGLDAQATAALAAATEVPARGWLLVLGRPWLRWRQRRRWRRVLRHLNTAGRAPAAPLEKLLAERQRLQMQMQSLAVTRRLLSLWHVVHIPLGGVLFTLAFIHVGAALYYATFLR